ncbi:IS3 family transposase [Peribacillus simplex]|uniref:IS3 family transposase n=1 Tax=Peribacillus simplex TaxID=1478 RepID=A0AAW7IGP6_9BACI|nr:IS3 family transposase [Peribacillus simplex]MDM5451052.1 IS3 family transposase [Peribacillus simplex]
MTKRERRTFSSEFKKQMIQLYQNGKTRKALIEEYELTPSSLNRWIQQGENTGSFKEKDNRSPEESEHIQLRKELKQLQMENDIFKASSADTRTKVNVIKRNKDKYSVSAMCNVLDLSRSTYYYESKERNSEDDVTHAIIEIFEKNRKVYGTRKIKVEGLTVSRRRIGRIMKEQGLVSSYTVAQYKPQQSSCNESVLANELNREFQQKEEKKVVVSDLTYVKDKNKWHYICVFVDLFNREIIGFSTGPNKDAQLVARAFASIKGNLHDIQLFHTDRGNDFKNKLIDETLTTFKIGRSLSMKGCPYDNAFAEATFKIIKTEFANQKKFTNLSQLTLEFGDYVNWFNKLRIHGTLGYLSPLEYKELSLKKVV